jgi:type II secretory pathway component PulK
MQRNVMCPHHTKQNGAEDAAASRPPQGIAERGVALLLVIFMIALSAILLVSLADSTYVTMRLNSATERRVQAEYILKSAVHFARVLIKNDITPQDDPTQDAWMQFADGREIPGETLGIPEPNVRISLAIISQGGKFPMQRLLGNNAQPDKQYIEILARLLNNLGFNNPSPAGSSPSRSSAGGGPAQQRDFTAEQLVANIVDYLDTDQTSFSLPGLPGTFQGIEGDLDSESPLRNEGRFDALASELASVPGFTPEKVQKLFNYVANTRAPKININSASSELIRALDPNITEADEKRISDFRTPGGGGPFTANDLRQQLNGLIDSTIVDRLSPILTADTTNFNVIAKVDYGTSVFMGSAELRKTGSGKLPELKAMLLY